MANPPLSTSDSEKLISNIALGAIIVCPIIILLPPRKFDAYTISLLATTAAGANQVAYDFTGRSLMQRERAFMESLSPGSDLPPAAKEIQKRLKEEKAARLAAKNGIALGSGSGSRLESEKGVLAELERKRVEAEEGDGEKKGILQRVWMGGEDKDWKAKRDQREKEALEDGRGYGGLIMDQIWEVWNWGKKEAEELKEEDEKVVAQKKEESQKK